MPAQFIALLAVIVIAGMAAGLLSSKAMSEKLVAAGILPRTFLSLIPALQLVIRIFGVGLVVAGGISLSVQAGWINRDVLEKYGLSAVVIIIGLVLLLMSPRKPAAS